MRKLLIFLLVIPLISCKSDLDKSKEAIKNYLFTTLKDYDSYQEIETSQVYIWSEGDNDTEIRDIREHVNLGHMLLKLGNDPTYTGEKSEIDKLRVETLNNIEYLIQQMDNICNKSKIGDSYWVKQKFRAKNSFGGYNISEIWFKLDDKFKVIYTININ